MEKDCVLSALPVIGVEVPSSSMVISGDGHVGSVVTSLDSDSVVSLSGREICVDGVTVVVLTLVGGTVAKRLGQSSQDNVGLRNKASQSGKL